MIEYIARVDENDVVTGKTTKQESHKNGWHHRVVAIFVMRGDKLLINRREDNGLLDHSVGGHVLYGEEYGAAARRESFEEIGLPENIPIKYLEKFLVSEKNDNAILRHWFSLYRVNIDDAFIPQAQAGEVRELFFQNIFDVISDMETRPDAYTRGFRTTIKVFIKYNK